MEKVEKAHESSTTLQGTAKNHGPRKTISEEERREIKALAEKGLTQKEIPVATGIGTNAVIAVLKGFPTYSAYLDDLAKKRKEQSHAEHLDKIAKIRGFETIGRYNLSQLGRRGYESIHTYEAALQPPIKSIVKVLSENSPMTIEELASKLSALQKVEVKPVWVERRITRLNSTDNPWFTFNENKQIVINPNSDFIKEWSIALALPQSR